VIQDPQARLRTRRVLGPHWHDSIEVESSQLLQSCGGPTAFFAFGAPNPTIAVQLDNEGNATVVFVGFDCAPGTDLVEASMQDAPFLTATTELTVSPPTVTAPGVYGFPTSSGTVSGGEVETGDTGPFASAVLAVFYVETDPVYAEQPVEISSPQLQDRCGSFSVFDPYPGPDHEFLDDDGNAVFLFRGSSCAAGTSVVTADVLAGTHPTYTTTFTILPPQPTI